jgi:CheY-like chemotaxis protein
VRALAERGTEIALTTRAEGLLSNLAKNAIPLRRLQRACYTRRVPTAVRSAKILIVEDEYLIALDEQNRLLSMGFENVVLTSSGELVLDRVRAECPDLVLMNLNLGGKMTSVLAAELIRRQCNAAIVFVSAYSPERAGVAGGELFLRKPFTDLAFRRAVEGALG